MSAGPRRQGESFARYRARLRRDERDTREHLRGTFVWISKAYYRVSNTWGWPYGGTYVRAKHGPIGRQRRA